MDRILHILLVFLFSLTIISCSEDKEESTTDTTALVIAEVKAVTTPTTDTTPNYTFSSTEAGTITYGGSCSSSTTSASSGNNTITLVSLSIGTYSDCTITLTDAAGNVSSSLTLSSFTLAESKQMGGSMQGGQLSLSTVVTTVAGTGSSGSADNTTGTSASFNKPYGIITDGTNLYVADRSNHLIRKIVISTGAVTTVAGTGSSGSANGTGTSASFYQPNRITTDGTNLYVAEYGNHLIRQIVISTGVVTTVAGIAGDADGGSANGTGTSASFSFPYGITTDGTNLYVADMSNNLIRQIE